MIVSLGVNTAIDLLSSRLERHFSEVSVIVFTVLNILLVLIVLTALFTAIFKVLPDGHVRWKECMIGAIFTAVLFAIGKSGISLYLGQQDLGATYGASASIVILLTWVYYSSIILYFGAEFTKVYAKTDGEDISPNEHAVLISRQEVVEKHGAGVTNVPEPSFKMVASLPEEGKKLIHTVIKFIDDKIDLVKQQILPVFESVAATITFYVITAIVGFSILVTCLILLGNFLNQALDSYYLGYLILLGVFLILGTATILLRKKVLDLVRKTLLAMNKA